jgi:hypothetical protein
MVDMAEFVAPKSSQLNADDLIAGPRTIRVSRVSGTGNGEQPVAVSFEGDDGKPYLPCKSMRRVMIAAWGADATQYVGRSMTLYRDPKVLFGGMAVGGIRISHMSHIEGDMKMALTVTQKKRELYTVKPLAVAAADKAAAGVAVLVDRIAGAADLLALEAITGAEDVMKQRAWLASKRPDLAQQVDDAVAAALVKHGDGWPGDRQPGEGE